MLSPFYRDPDHPSFNRRAYHHDYTKPARYLITIIKNPAVPSFSRITGDPYSKNTGDIRTELLETGLHIPDTIKAWSLKYPVFVENYAIMPDHLHITINVISHLPNGLSRAIANLMGMITKATGLDIPAFSKGYNDRIAYTTQQWQSQIHYVRDNPRRYLIKKMYPDYLLQRWLLNMGNNIYVLRGNIFLLRQPLLFRVKTSRRFTSQEAGRATAAWQRELYNGGVPVSPFIHPHEKALRDFAIDTGFPYIRICTNGFSDRESASGKEFELMAQGRLLLVGQSEFSTRKEDLKYKYASQLNDLASDIVESCNTGISLSLKQLKS